MRTTVDLEEDVLLAVKERARREHRSAGAVLTELARKALTQDAGDPGESFFGFTPLRSGRTVVSNDLVDRLRDEEGV